MPGRLNPRSGRSGRRSRNSANRRRLRSTFRPASVWSSWNAGGNMLIGAASVHPRNRVRARWPLSAATSTWSMFKRSRSGTNGHGFRETDNRNDGCGTNRRTREHPLKEGGVRVRLKCSRTPANIVRQCSCSPEMFAMFARRGDPRPIRGGQIADEADPGPSPTQIKRDNARRGKPLAEGAKN